MAPLVLALAAGAMSASYALCLRLAAGGISPALGALIVSATALPFTIGVFVAMRDVPTGLTFSTRGAVLMILAGVFAASTTIFGILAYSRGFKLSSSPIVIATQMSLMLIVGVVALDEPLGAGRFLALALIALGVFLLQRAGV
jgi:drug/metabolite transporter (DMT)-like permease